MLGPTSIVGDLMIRQARIIFCPLTEGDSSTQKKTSYNACHGNFLSVFIFYLPSPVLNSSCCPVVLTICIFIKSETIVATSKLPGPRQESQHSHINGKKLIIVREFFKGSKKEAGFKWKAKINNSLRAGWAFGGPTQVPLPAPHKCLCLPHTYRWSLKSFGS